MSDKKLLETKSKQKSADKFIEGVDYYFDNGLMVLTTHFLFNRGYCCENNCRHCPYPKAASVELQKESV